MDFGCSLGFPLSLAKKGDTLEKDEPHCWFGWGFGGCVWGAGQEPADPLRQGSGPLMWWALVFYPGQW